MTRRLDKTLADYVGIAISPVLIMTLVGSLLFFLVEVFYQGGYTGRLYWVFGFFTMGAVALGRVSIEEGRERAIALGAPLGVAAYLALMTFVQFNGVLAGVSWAVNLFLLGLVWWCAHKLTWDCTLIDEAEDASGEGLLQTIGMDEKVARAGPPEPDRREEPEPDEPEGVTSRDARELSWWERFIERRRRPHAPGVWVVYFSLAALPLFGIGHLFIPVEDPASRRFAFLLLLVYVASGLGLLLMTSFLGLRRYLRQRHLEMPPAMAGTWIAIGTALVVGLLLVSSLLPRPGAELDLVKLPFRVDSPTRQSSRYAVMKGEAADEDQGGPRSGTRDDDQAPGAKSEGDEQGSGGESKSQEGSAGESKSKEGSAGKGADSQQGGSQPSSQGEKGGSSGSKEGSEDSRSQSGAEKGSSSNQNKPGSQGKSEPGGEAKKSEGGGQQGKSEGGGEQGKSEGSQEARSTDGTKPGETEPKPGEQPAGSPPESKTAASESRGGKQGERREDGSRTSSGRGWRERENRSEQSRPPESKSKAAEDRSTSGGANRRPWLDPTAIARTLVGSFSTLFKWVFIAILAGVIGYWAWRCRAELLKTLRDLLEGWRAFWARLFGGKTEAGAAAAPEETGPQGPGHRRFAEFPDPFLSGLADRAPADEVVRYTFDALEAWAREHGWPRQPEQTPHEFALDLGSRVDSLSLDVRRLADLYCRVAYAPGTLPPKSTAPLKQLWQELRHREPVGVSTS
jgi:hypothetical protein